MGDLSWGPRGLTWPRRGSPGPGGGMLTRTHGLWSLAPAEESTSSPGQTIRRALGQKEEREKFGRDMRSEPLLRAASALGDVCPGGGWPVLSHLARTCWGQALCSRWVQTSLREAEGQARGLHKGPVSTPGRLVGAQRQGQRSLEEVCLSAGTQEGPECPLCMWGGGRALWRRDQER